MKELDRQTTVPAEDISQIANRVAERAETQLRRNGHVATQDISCSYHEGVLLLRGRVPTYYLKQVAQTVVMRVDGVEQVDNRIEVGTSPAPRSTTGHDDPSECDELWRPRRPR